MDVLENRKCTEMWYRTTRGMEVKADFNAT